MKLIKKFGEFLRTHLGWLMVLPLILTTSIVQGQQSITQIRESKLEQVYFEQFGPRNILSGKIYNETYDLVSGHPFLFDYYEGEGYFIYDGIQYKNLPFQYDIYNQVFLVKPLDKTNAISIDFDKVSEFNSANFKFLSYQNDNLSKGLYELAYPGVKSRLMIKHSKEVKKLTQRIHGKLRQFVTKNQYFVVINGNTTEIRNRKDLFEVFGNDRSMVDRIKKSGLTFKKKDLVEKLVSIMAYYERL